MWKKEKKRKEEEGEKNKKRVGHKYGTGKDLRRARSRPALTLIHTYVVFEDPLVERCLRRVHIPRLQNTDCLNVNGGHLHPPDPRTPLPRPPKGSLKFSIQILQRCHATLGTSIIPDRSNQTAFPRVAAPPVLNRSLEGAQAFPLGLGFLLGTIQF